MELNIVDWIILGILGISVLVGLYRGFVASLASLGSSLAAVGLSFWLTPRAVEWVSSQPELIRTLMSYTDAATRIGDQALAQTPVSSLNAGTIGEILSRVNLPEPLASLLRGNLQGQVFQPGGVTQVGDYVSQTITSAMLNVICFIACFILIFIAMHLILGFLKAVFTFPVLKQMNSLAGGVFGLLRGALLCVIAFALLPLVQTAVPLKEIDQLIAASALAPMFNANALIMAVMNGGL